MRAPTWLTLGLVVALVACAPTTERETADTATEESGDQIFDRVCAVCHGVDGRGGVSAPDLLDVANGMTVQDLTEVILYGSGYMEPLRLTEEDAIAVSEYIVDVYLADSP